MLQLECIINCHHNYSRCHVKNIKGVSIVTVDNRYIIKSNIDNYHEWKVDAYKLAPTGYFSYNIVSFVV